MMTITQIRIDEDGNARVMFDDNGKLKTSFVRLKETDELNLLLALVEKKLNTESSEDVKNSMRKDRLDRIEESRKKGREAANKEREKLDNP